jgi:adenylate cyclase
MGPSSERRSTAGIAKPAEPIEREAPRGLSLRTKALALFLLVAIAPVAILLGVTLRGYARALRSNEERMQLLVVRDVASDAERTLSEVDGDVAAVAAAVAIARTDAGRDDAVLTAIRAVLAARPSLPGVRLDIPASGASVPFVKAGMDPAALPASTETLRAAADADESGRALEIDGPRAILVVRVPASGADQPAAYVSAPLWLAPIEADLAEAIDRNGAGGRGTHVVLVDAHLREVASYPAAPRPDRGPGRDASALPVWSLLGDPAAALGRAQFGAAGVFTDGGEARFGTIHGAGERRWAVAVSRPEAIALAEYHAVRRVGAWIAAGVLVVALAIGLVASRAITRPVLDVVTRVRLIGARRWSEQKPLAARGDELGTLADAIDRMAVDLEASEALVAKEARLRGDLSRFLGTELVDAIVRGEHSLELGGERREVTVLFADVVAFTPIAERGKPEVVVAMLNELFTILSEVVFRHGGTVDKFVGDSIMAVFGAPVSRADHADRALAAAEDMIQFVETAADEWRERFDVDVRIGIGVSSGEVVVGNIGSKKRMEYTVIGDAVNVASRLESLAGPNQVLVGESTAKRASEGAPLRHVGERALLGRTEPTVVYELV